MCKLVKNLYTDDIIPLKKEQLSVLGLCKVVGGIASQNLGCSKPDDQVDVGLSLNQDSAVKATSLSQPSNLL